MTTLVLQGELGQRLTIDVKAYDQERPRDMYDANWLACSIELVLGRFRGSIDASLTTHDFASFLSSLSQMLRGAERTATFQTMEEALSIRIDATHTGQVIVAGKLRETHGDQTELLFSFRSDLSFVQKAHADLEHVVSEFPERLEPRNR